MRENLKKCYERLFKERHIFNSKNEIVATCSNEAFRTIKVWAKNTGASIEKFGDFLSTFYNIQVKLVLENEMIKIDIDDSVLIRLPQIDYAPHLELRKKDGTVMCINLKNEMFVESLVVKDQTGNNIIKYSDDQTYTYIFKSFFKGKLEIRINKLTGGISKGNLFEKEDLVQDLLNGDFTKRTISMIKQKYFEKNTIKNSSSATIELTNSDKIEIYKAEEAGKIQKYILFNNKEGFEFEVDSYGSWKYVDKYVIYSYDASTRKIKAPIPLTEKELKEIQERIKSIKKEVFNN